MTDEYEYFWNKRSNQVYVSKPFGEYKGDGRRMRYISKVFDSPEQHQLVQVKDEIVLRVTHNQRWEVKALVYEDPRDIHRITIQRFTAQNGKPHQLSITLSGDEIGRLYDLLRAVKFINLDDEERQRLDADVLADLLLNADERKQFFRANAELIADILENDLSTAEIVALAHRKKQLEIFGRLLHESGYFEQYQHECGIKKTEAVWQSFFEQNLWIFGYGLDYIFTTGFDDRKLEQFTSGHSIVFIPI